MSTERVERCEPNQRPGHIDFEQRDTEEADSQALVAGTSRRYGSDEELRHRRADYLNRDQPKLQEATQVVYTPGGGR